MVAVDFASAYASVAQKLQDQNAIKTAAEALRGQLEHAQNGAEVRTRLVWGFTCQAIVFGLLTVLCSEVCPGKASMFSRRQSCRVKVRAP